MKRAIKLTVLVTLMVVLMGTMLNAQQYDTQVNFNIVRNPCVCYWKGPNGFFNIEVYYRVGTKDILDRVVLDVPGGDTAIQFSSSIAKFLGATGIKLIVTPASGSGSPQTRVLGLNSGWTFDFIFPFMDTVLPHTHQ